MTDTQAIDCHIDTRHTRGQRLPFGDALIHGSKTECEHESHCQGALCEFEPYTDMCDPDEVHMEGLR